MKSNRATLLYAAPFGVGVLLFAPDLVAFVLGDAWDPAVSCCRAWPSPGCWRRSASTGSRSIVPPATPGRRRSRRSWPRWASWRSPFPGLALWGADGFVAGRIAAVALALVWRARYVRALLPGVRLARCSAGRRCRSRPAPPPHSRYASRCGAGADGRPGHRRGRALPRRSSRRWSCAPSATCSPSCGPDSPARASRAPARTTATSVSAGISQSQSMALWKVHTASAAIGPAASSGSARWSGARGERHGAEERGEQRDADEPQLGERLELERVRVADDLVDVALAQPCLPKAAGAHAGQRVVEPGVHRHAPVVVAVGAQRGEALVRGAGRGRRPADGHRAATIGTTSSAAIAAERGPARPARQGERAVGRAGARGERRGGRRGRARPRARSRPRARAWPAPVERAYARRGGRGERAGRARREHEHARRAAGARVGAEEHEREQAGGQRGQRTAREAQVAAHARAARRSRRRSRAGARGRVPSPATRAHSTSPIAASAPVAFQ